jgi:hypothetical protein
MGKVINRRFEFYYRDTGDIFGQGYYISVNNQFTRLQSKKGYIIHHDTLKEWKPISETDKIQETLTLERKVLIKDKELRIEKIVQKDNGDIICYLDTVVEIIEDRLSKDMAEDTFTNYQEAKKQREEHINKEKIIICKKKWWQFWKSK